jgi:hypothetical protein
MGKRPSSRLRCAGFALALDLTASGDVAGN